MKIAVFISGFLRTIDYNFPKLDNILKNYKVDYYLHISLDDNKDRYTNKKISIQEILDLVKPKQCIIEKEQIFDSCKFINIKRMWYKIYSLNLLKKKEEDLFQFKYDLVIRIRPDLHIIDKIIDFENYNLQSDCIYGKMIDKKLLDEFNFGNSQAMDYYCELFLSFDKYLENEIIRPDLELLYYHFKNTYYKFRESNIKHKLLLSLCNIIAISGDSGSGKTTLMKNLEFIFKNDLLKIEGDRYHKWERGDKHWEMFTHLNPNANYISKYCDDVFNLKIGEDIYQVDYDHTIGKFTEIKKLENKSNIILCGLHTLFDKETNNLFNFKIFLDTDNNLRKYWKIKRDILNRGYDLDIIIKQIEDRETDYEKFIKPQKQNTDLIINFYIDENFDYKNLENNPTIYLKLKINDRFNLIEFIKKLNIFRVDFKYYKREKWNVLEFNKIQDNFKLIFMDIIVNNFHIYKSEHKLSYYTIIISLVIFLIK
jgi:uridine kinase